MEKERTIVLCKLKSNKSVTRQFLIRLINLIFCTASAELIDFQCSFQTAADTIENADVKCKFTQKQTLCGQSRYVYNCSFIL